MMVIAIDGGGTKTHLVTASTEGTLSQVFEAGGTNYLQPDAYAEWLRLLGNIEGQQVQTASFTVSGWDYPEDQQQQKALILKALEVRHVQVGQLLFENDIYATFQSGLQGEKAGIAISAGTGIIGMVETEEVCFRTPGYEYLGGEWGSGLHMAEYGLHLACASLLGRHPHYPELTSRALTYFDAPDLEALIKAIAASDQRKKGYFLSAIYQAWEVGCPGASLVIEQEALELARTAWALIQKGGGRNMPIVFGGGVIQRFGLPSAFYQHLQALSGQTWECRLVESEPVWGSLYWALEKSGLDPTPARDRIRIRRLTSPATSNGK
jgi:N-acetylglucosamine kinase-like BadF-type ATPase